MESNDPLVMALIALCKAQGGERVVADESGISAENLAQITKGVKLPSGKPRGVGPGIRAKITKAFPDWLINLQNQPAPKTQQANLVTVSVAPEIAQLCQMLCNEFSKLPNDDGVRMGVMGQFAAIIAAAREPPSKQTVPDKSEITKPRLSA